MIHEIVIIGGGFGGVKIAKDLARKTKDTHVTLIDKNKYHSYHPNFYEVATAFIPEKPPKNELRFHELVKTSSVHFEEIFLNDLNVSFLEGEAADIDFKNKEVILKSGLKKKYDFLVIAVGSETNYFGMQPLQEKSMPLKDLNDALQIRNAIDELFANSPKNKLLKIVIGGGGFTGCEFALELTGYLKTLSKIHGRPEHYAQISIVDLSPILLSTTSPWVQQKVKERLEFFGVNIILSTGIDEITDFDILVWTGGVMANSLTKNLSGIKLEKASCILIDSYMRVLPYEDVFGVGDAVYCVNEKTGKAMPMTASMALREAKYVAENIKRSIEKNKLLRYEPKFPGFIIPLGGKYALFEKDNFHLSGIIPWLMKYFISLCYWIGLLGFLKGVRIWMKGMKIFIKND
ncbi:MAG: FAD-dependent oxidoreductase [Patescibacteria group bacterium]